MPSFPLRRSQSSKNLSHHLSSQPKQPPPSLPPLLFLPSSPPASDSSSTAWSVLDSPMTDSGDSASGVPEKKRERSSSVGSRKTGIGGFFKSIGRSGSKSGRKREAEEDGRKGRETIPSVPSLPSSLLKRDFEDGAKSASATSVKVIAVGGSGTSFSSKVKEVKPDPPSSQAEKEDDDLGALLRLVQQAGDKFSDSTTSSGELLPTPTGSSFSPSSSLYTSTAKPRFSFLAHLSPSSLRRSPGSPLLFTPPASPLPHRVDPESDDDYGGSSDDNHWTSRATSSFSRAAVQALPKSPQALPRLPKQRLLGTGARRVVDLTLARLSSLTDPEALHPLSVNGFATLNGRPGSRSKKSMRETLGRLGVVRRLRRGVSMMQGLELERRTPERRSEDSEDEESSETVEELEWGRVLEPFEVDGVMPFVPGSATPPPPTKSRINLTITLPLPPTTAPIHPLDRPTPSSIRKWLARPSFAQSHISYVATDFVVNPSLIRARPWQERVQSSGSARLRVFASSDMRVDTAREQDEGTAVRPKREGKPTLGGRRGSLKGLGITTAKPQGQLVLPVPLLLQSLALDPSQLDEPGSDDDAPLAVLQNRSNGNSPRLPPPSPALIEATERAAALEAEVARMRKNERRRVEKEERRERDMREREETKEEARREEEKAGEVARRTAEQRRRSRAMGQRSEGDDRGVREGKSASRLSTRPTSFSKEPTTRGAEPAMPAWSPQMVGMGYAPVMTPQGMMVMGVVPSPGQMGIAQPSFHANSSFATSAPNLPSYYPQHLTPLPPLPTHHHAPHHSPSPPRSSRRPSRLPDPRRSSTAPQHVEMPSSPHRSPHRGSLLPPPSSRSPRNLTSTVPPVPTQQGMSRLTSGLTTMGREGRMGEAFLKVEQAGRRQR